MNKKLIFVVTVLLLISSIPNIFNVLNIIESKAKFAIKKIAEIEQQKIVLRFNTVEFKKLKWFDDNEFEHDGSMYDVISIQKNGAQYLVTCESDTKETTNLKALITSIHHTKEQNSNSFLLKLKAENLTIPTHPISFNFILDCKITPTAMYGNSLYHAALLSCITPPPKAV